MTMHVILAGWKNVTVSSQVRLTSCGLAAKRYRMTMHVVVSSLLSGCIRCERSEAWLELAALAPATQSSQFRLTWCELAGKQYRMTVHVVVSSLLGGCVSSDTTTWLEGSIVTIAGQILTYTVAEALVASRTVCWVWRTRDDMNYMEIVTAVLVACRMRQACLLQQPQAHV